MYLIIATGWCQAQICQSKAQIKPPLEHLQCQGMRWNLMCPSLPFLLSQWPLSRSPAHRNQYSEPKSKTEGIWAESKQKITNESIQRGLQLINENTEQSKKQFIPSLVLKGLLKYHLREMSWTLLLCSHMLPEYLDELHQHLSHVSCWVASIYLCFFSIIDMSLLNLKYLDFDSNASSSTPEFPTALRIKVTPLQGTA